MHCSPLTRVSVKVRDDILHFSNLKLGVFNVQDNTGTNTSTRFYTQRDSVERLLKLGNFFQVKHIFFTRSTCKLLVLLLYTC